MGRALQVPSSFFVRVPVCAPHLYWTTVKFEFDMARTAWRTCHLARAFCKVQCTGQHSSFAGRGNLRKRSACPSATAAAAVSVGFAGTLSQKSNSCAPFHHTSCCPTHPGFQWRIKCNPRIHARLFPPPWWQAQQCTVTRRAAWQLWVLPCRTRELDL